MTRLTDHLARSTRRGARSRRHHVDPLILAELSTIADRQQPPTPPA